MRFYCQPLSHARRPPPVLVTLDQVGCLVRDIGLQPVHGKLRLIASEQSEQRPRFSGPAGKREASTQHPARTLEAWPQALRFDGPMDGLVEAACGVLGDCDASKEQGLLRVKGA